MATWIFITELLLYVCIMPQNVISLKTKEPIKWLKWISLTESFAVLSQGAGGNVRNREDILSGSVKKLHILATDTFSHVVTPRKAFQGQYLGALRVDHLTYAGFYRSFSGNIKENLFRLKSVAIFLEKFKYIQH